MITAHTQQNPLFNIRQDLSLPIDESKLTLFLTSFNFGRISKLKASASPLAVPETTTIRRNIRGRSIEHV